MGTAPEPWNQFGHYRDRQAYYDPIAMMQNQLLERVVPGLILKDDNPLAIRNNHGTIQVGSVLGGKWGMYEDNPPWIKPWRSTTPVRALANSTEPADLSGGVIGPSIKTLCFYTEQLAKFPKCRRAIQISMPDLQGPFDTAEQLWGSPIYYAFSDEADLFERLLTRIVHAMLTLACEFRQHARDRPDPEANTQHGYRIPGRLLIRNDSSIMLSPDMYAEFVRPHDARVLHEVGTGAIHFCGNGQHLVEKMLEIPSLRGLDFGQSELMDMATIYAQCRERNVAVTNLRPSRDDLMNGNARAQFPTGCVLVYATENLDDARKVVRAYQSHTG